MRKSTQIEKICTQYFQQHLYTQQFFPSFGPYKVMDILPPKFKADTRVLIQHPYSNDTLICGIQTKSADSFNYENWISPTKHPHIRTVRDQWRDPAILNILRNRLMRRRVSRDTSSQILKIALCVTNQPTPFGWVEHFRHKHLYIFGSEPCFDLFFYDAFRRSTEEQFYPRIHLRPVTPQFVVHTSMYYSLRPIYCDSGDTQQQLPDIFEGTYASELQIINQ